MKSFVSACFSYKVNVKFQILSLIAKLFKIVNLEFRYDRYLILKSTWYWAGLNSLVEMAEAGINAICKGTEAPF